ncbi:MAG TPA: SPOR domain-containing protein [Gemmatimonadaceae bacterium]
MGAVTLAIALTVLSGCSREKIDWKSAEAADTVESYDHFLARHPEGELATQARARIAQLNEERAWKRASAADTPEAYRQFLAQHENGKWAEEARIRIENFALDGSATHPAGAAAEPAVTESASTAAPPRETRAPPPAAPAAATPPPGAAAAPVAQYGIQLGAFRSQEAALKDWKRLQVQFDSDLHGLFAKAVPVQQSGGQLFRLQAPVGEEARARAICASLVKQSQPCVIVLPPTQ